MADTRQTRRAFTILEMAVTVIVLSIIAASILPVLNASTNAYANAASVRDATEHAAFAMDRCVRMLRETPDDAQAGTPDITRAEASAIEFGDGNGVELDEGTLWQLSPGSPRVPLCRDVTEFQIDYLGADGVTDTMASPSETKRYGLKLVTGGIELRCAAFIRVTIGQS